jgi:eukaryotic-like serine/threonine-protein kinase
MAAVDLATGSIFARRYQILRRLASGGMGAVYEALHLETRRRRALKVMLPELFTKPELRDRFRREAHVTSSVKSEFLVDVFDAGLDEASGMPFLVMELLEGEDLGRLVEREGPLAPSDVVAHLSQVASALDRTHAASIVHRDLKPENLFLTHREDGSSCVKILDFGISKVMNEAATGGPNTTSIGTPAYMAPEQIVGGPVTPAADIHALGLIAYTLLTGRAYWQDDVESTDNALAFALRAAQGIREGAVSRAHRHGHELPVEFDAWFACTAALDPKRRFRTASEAALALADALGVPAPAVVPAPSASRPAARAQKPANTSAPHTGGDFVPSTMHGAELGATQRKPSTRLLWLGAAALGLSATAVAAFVSRDERPPGAGTATSEVAVSAAAALPTTSAPAVIVTPVEAALVTPIPPASSAAPALRPPARPAPAAVAKPARLATPVASAPLARSASPLASDPAPPSTASFPAASSAPKIRYTRD